MVTIADAKSVMPDRRFNGEDQELTQRELRVGDRVRITNCDQKAHTGGWRNSWNNEMIRRASSRSPTVFTINKIIDAGVYFDEIGYGWPPSSLELVD